MSLLYEPKKSTVHISSNFFFHFFTANITNRNDRHKPMKTQAGSNLSGFRER